nr:unnamed protein product [Callosobruchus analis]
MFSLIFRRGAKINRHSKPHEVKQLLNSKPTSSSRSICDFDAKFFWNWTDFQSYVDCMLVFTICASLLMYIFIDLSMVILWTCGDIFKTTYFLVREAPIQFWVCGSIQVTVDILILLQYDFVLYAGIHL